MLINGTRNSPVKVFVLLLIVVTFISCKKDKLKKEGKDELIGEYDWIYSARSAQYSGSTILDTIHPLTEFYTFKMKFFKNGKIHFFRDGEVIKRRRIVFTNWRTPIDGGHMFSIDLNNNEEEDFKGSLDLRELSDNGDTIVTFNYFPYADNQDCPLTADAGCDYTHYFVKK